MFRIAIVCPGVAEHLGPEAASDIQREFEIERRWHQNVRYTFAGGQLTLVVENDFDESGLALQDEFSDCISSFLASSPEGGQLIIRVDIIG
jgi:hypothetical protein